MHDGKHSEAGSPVSTNAGKPRVLLADDHTLVVEAFTKLLEPEFDVVGTVADGRSLLEIAPQLNPDLVLLDLSMPLMNGRQAGERLKKILPKTKVIVLTMSEDPDVAAEVLRSWASGFLPKKSAATELVKAIGEVLRGKQYVASPMRSKLRDALTHGRLRDRTTTLTPRQREVLQLLAEGCTMKEAANALHVTARTIAFHKYKIMEGLGLKNNSDLLRVAIKEGLVFLS
jgi:DNA-binding NarL/FixJ family response regulator